MDARTKRRIKWGRINHVAHVIAEVVDEGYKRDDADLSSVERHLIMVLAEYIATYVNDNVEPF